MTILSKMTVGRNAPDFTLPDGLGNTFTLLDNIPEKGLLVAFIHNTWCPECMRGIIRFRQIYTLIHRLGVDLLVVAHQNEASLTAYLLSQPRSLPFTILADADGHTFQAYQLQQTHDLHQVKATFYIDKNLIIRKANIGLIDSLLTPFGI